ncbi:hypothetical protein F4678DRAFT_93002 [Xylaria arbuscula]|nr:hypothetical protein F4678DRAFT_93002 [Xylaria arbuscula]
MRLKAFTALTTIFQLVQSAPFLSLNRRDTLPQRLVSSTCEFYGYMDKEDDYNEYIIKMAGWGNDGSAKSCASDVTSLIQAQCETKLDSFVCSQVYENLHDTQITFRIRKATHFQPDCVTEALRVASLYADDEQTIECSCLAECWQTQRRI